MGQRISSDSICPERFLEIGLNSDPAYAKPYKPVKPDLFPFTKSDFSQEKTPPTSPRVRYLTHSAERLPLGDIYIATTFLLNNNKKK